MGQQHTYEQLYKLSPKLYNSLYFIRNRSVNLLYLFSNKRISFTPTINEIYKKEYLEILDKLNDADRNSTTNIMPEAALYLYNLVRTRKPSIFLETGVAKGFSTRIILEAMKKNNSGLLVSTEVEKDVGSLVPKELHDRWELVVGNPKTILSSTLRRYDKIDIFLHDSVHSYVQMFGDFVMVEPHIAEHGILLSDDVNENRAFLDFAKRIGANPRIITSYKKCFGIIEL